MSISSTPTDTQQQKSTETTVDVAQEFLTKASDYFQSEMKCMFILFSND
jgi:hypothetical protein